MKVKIEIDTDNAAFEERPETEVARILEELAGKLRDREAHELSMRLRDINGNTVGVFSVAD